MVHAYSRPVVATLVLAMCSCGCQRFDPAEQAAERYLRQRMLQPWESLEEVRFTDHRAVAPQPSGLRELEVVTPSLDEKDARVCTRRLVIAENCVRVITSVSGDTRKTDECVVPRGGSVLRASVRVLSEGLAETAEHRAERWRSFDHICYTSEASRHEVGARALYNVLLFITPEGRCVGHLPGYFWGDYLRAMGAAESSR